MNYEKAESKVYDLVKILLNEFNDSKYTVIKNLEDDDQPIQMSISGLSTIDGYEAHLLELSNDLINILSFASTSPARSKDKLILWATKQLNKYQCTIWPIAIDKSAKNEVSETLMNDFEAIQIPLFQAIKKEVHTWLLSNLKGLVFDDLSFAFPQLVWKGNQKQLAQVFAQLIKQKWIAQPTSKSQFAETLNAIFDLSDTTRYGSTNKSEYLRVQLEDHPRQGFKCLTSDHPFNLISENEHKKL